MLTRAQKEEQVSVLKDKLNRATSMFVADYRGLSVAEVNELRGKIYGDGSGEFEYAVTKNSILRRASEGLPAEGAAEHFSGPTAIALSYGDSVQLAKLLVGFAKEHEAFEIQGGVVDGDTLTDKDVTTLATLPSLDELRGKIVGLLQAPATKLARVLQAPAGQLARVASARGEQGE